MLNPDVRQPEHAGHFPFRIPASRLGDQHGPRVQAKTTRRDFSARPLDCPSGAEPGTGVRRISGPTTVAESPTRADTVCTRARHGGAAMQIVVHRRRLVAWTISTRYSSRAWSLRRDGFQLVGAHRLHGTKGGANAEVRSSVSSTCDYRTTPLQPPQPSPSSAID